MLLAPARYRGACYPRSKSVEKAVTRVLVGRGVDIIGILPDGYSFMLHHECSVG